MDVTIRTDFDQAAACELYGLDPEEITCRFAGAASIGHWFAYDEHGVAIGVSVATERPDGRVFLTHRLAAERAYGPLLREALGAIAGPVHVTIRSDQSDYLSVVRGIGLEHELTSTTYEVRFDRILATLPAPRATTDYRVARVDDVDPDQVYELDIALRNDVPGNDGWRGNRTWFDDELGGSECDPTGYLVALEKDSGDMIGLCRMWRNHDGPALGMLGVRRERRNGFMALRLLHDTLTVARDWGWPTFTTHTARPGLQRHVDRAGAVEQEAFHRFVRL